MSGCKGPAASTGSDRRATRNNAVPKCALRTSPKPPGWSLTSYVERQNLTMDAHAPLYALTNAFSKKIENHARAVALHPMY
jgi:hypothetical protein